MLVAAAVLMVAIGLVHSVLGERYILTRLFRRDLPKILGSDRFTKKTLRFAWHITTVAWCGFAAVLLVGLGSERATLRVISLTFLATGVITLVAGRGRHLAWVVFLAIAGLTWWAP